MFRKFVKYYKPYVWIVAADLLCAVLSTLCELIFPLIVRYITETALSSGTALLISSVLKLGAFYLFLRIVDTAANYYMANMGHVMGAMLETDMRRDMFSHLMTLSNNYYDDAKVGQIMSRVTSDLFDITEFAHHCPEELFISSIKIIGSFCILFPINRTLTLILFLLLPLMGVSAAVLRKKMKSAFKEQRVKIGELNAELEDTLLGIRVVKSFAAEEREKNKLGKGNKEFFETKKKSYKYMALFQSTTRLSDGILNIGVITIGSLFMIKGKIAPTDLITYLLYIQTLITSVRRIVEFSEQFQRGMAGIERFNEIMELKPEITDIKEAKELKNVKGDIRMENISFKYEKGSNEVLKDINIDVKSGESIAIVGPSGGGKTTLCNLIPRFYDVMSGRILIDGKDIREVTMSSLRENIGVVQQDVYLFSGTVYDNILYGRPDATKEEVIEAAKAAGAHSFITELKDGYDSYVGERGLKLSGGQKQRISIARMFLKNPSIIVLDEATSALDNESELIVQKSLEKLAKGRTAFIIAHRLTTIKNADRILFLTEEGIEEEGSHKELIEADGKYAKLYSLYNKI